MKIRIQNTSIEEPRRQIYIDFYYFEVLLAVV